MHGPRRGRAVWQMAGYTMALYLAGLTGMRGLLAGSVKG